MRFVTPALKHIVFPALSRSGYLRYTAANGPTVVTYHGVFPTRYKIKTPSLDGNLVHSASLRQQVHLLKTHYNVISPEDFLHWLEQPFSNERRSGEKLPPRSILLTCDDALRNTLTEMSPLLQEASVSCLFFATGASAGDAPSMLWYEELYLLLLYARERITINLPEVTLPPRPVGLNERHACWWNLVEQLSQFDQERRRQLLDQIRDQLGHPPGWKDALLESSADADRFLTLNASGLRQLASAGMAIGAHTLSHPILARTSDELAATEISQSRTDLEKAVGQTISTFAYPFGTTTTVTTRDMHFAEQAGFQCAFMNSGGPVSSKSTRFALPRIHITANMSLSEFEAHISGFHRSLHHRFRRGDNLETASSS